MKRNSVEKFKEWLMMLNVKRTHLRMGVIQLANLEITIISLGRKLFLLWQIAGDGKKVCYMILLISKREMKNMIEHLRKQMH